MRPDRLVPMMHRHQPVMDVTGIVMGQEKPQQQHLSPKLSENKDREDRGHRRERTRSKSRDRRSKSSRSGGGGGSRRDRSRSRDRRRRDRSRGRDRSRDRHRNSGDRNSSSRGSGGGKSHRSRSPVTKMDNGKVAVGDQQMPIRPWACQYDGLQQNIVMNNQQPTTAMNTGVPGTMYAQFRTPPQPPIIPIHAPNAYQQQLTKQANEWANMNNEGRKQPYDPNYPEDSYDGSDDEDDRQAEYDNNLHKRFNDNSTPAMRRGGPPGQGFHDQQNYGPNRVSRFHKQSVPGGQQQNRGGHQRTFEEFGEGRNGGPRFNQQQPPKYGGRAGRGNSESSEGGRPTRFSSIQDGVGKPSRFNNVEPQCRNDGGTEFVDNSKKMPHRFNDRYRYDVRNAQTPRTEGLCVEVNNMCNHFSYGDIRKLFDGIHIDGSAIKIQKHRQGVAFVRFDNNYNKSQAMKMNGTAYKGNQIVVKHLDDRTYEVENTDDRPYPTTPAPAPVPAPTIVDHVDLVDDDDDNNENDNKPTAGNNKNDKQPVAAGDNNGSDDDCNLVVCEKSTKNSIAVGGGDGGNEQHHQPSSTVQEQPTKYLKLLQLPITVTEGDVLNEIDDDGKVRRVTIFPDGEFLGAVLEFVSPDAAEEASKRYDCVLLGSTPVPVLRCTQKEYVQIKRKTGGGGRRFSNDTGGNRHNHQQHLPQSHSPKPMPPPPNLPMHPVIHSNCVYVYGLPTSVTNTDITQFFADTSVLPDKIHIMLSKFGRPTGESYCEFGSVQQAHVALTKDQCYMGPNLVYVQPISRSDMFGAILKPMQQHNHHQDMSWTGGGMRGRGGHRQPNMMSSDRHHQGPQSLFGGGGDGSYGGGGGGGGGRPNQQYMNNGGRGVNIRGGGGGGGGGRGGYMSRMQGPPGLGPNTGPDGFGQPGCVVALDNVPYRADVQEIVDFFEGFDLNSQNVIRRFNDFGKPTGEARVNLRNPQEAMRAVRVLQNKPIFNRPVCLTLL